MSFNMYECLMHYTFYMNASYIHFIFMYLYKTCILHIYFMYRPGGPVSVQCKDAYKLLRFVICGLWMPAADSGHIQKSMRYRSMRLTLSRVRHVTFSQAARAMLNNCPTYNTHCKRLNCYSGIMGKDFIFGFQSPLQPAESHTLHARKCKTHTSISHGLLTQHIPKPWGCML
jgi:hypothetical protein